jgi:prepilin-type N-terminal cleavage/methylation domain-containing protein
MKICKTGFTLVEIVVSLFIMTLVMSIVGISIIQMNQSIYTANLDVKKYEQMNEFILETPKISQFQS